MKITLVTGSQWKLKEWRRILPSDVTLEHVDIDLPEIQSDDIEEIVIDKAKRAYAVAQRPVVVEDLSAGLVKHQGLPGPFIKFFVKKLGPGALQILAGEDGARAVVTCAIASYDGTDVTIATSIVHGTAVAPVGENGFGFDRSFIPDGSDMTFARMSVEDKDRVSHRALAIREFIEKRRKVNDE
jgi:non-canonical purine NTP pyrophosphatase (RdgB/HAM1 family)